MGKNTKKNRYTATATIAAASTAAMSADTTSVGLHGKAVRRGSSRAAAAGAAGCRATAAWERFQ
jgi:hypothetical protein